MDIDVAKNLIKNYTIGHSDFVMRAETAERYYRNQNDILFGKRSSDDEAENPLRNADNRIPRNFYGLLVNQKAAYLFTAPPIFDVGNDTANQQIAAVLGEAFAKRCKDLCIDASNAGIAWLHYWTDADGNFDYGVIRGQEIIPVWSHHINRKLLAVLRVYRDIDDDGQEWDIYEYWTDTECLAYRKRIDSTIDAGLAPYELFMDFAEAGMSAEANQYRHNFGVVPFIPFMNNNLSGNDLDNVKGLVDTYDKVYSGFVNDLEDIQEVIFLLTNYGGSDLNEFLSDIKKYKTVKLDAVNGDDRSGMETLTIDIPVEARDKLLDMTRKAIFEQGQGLDPQPQDFGNASGVALKYLYALLELKAGLMETEFQLAFGQLIRAICQHKGIAVSTIQQTWTRTAIQNTAELVTMCKDSSGIISQESIVRNHPFVDDADAEMKRIDKEKQDNMESMGGYPQMGTDEGGDQE